MNGDKKSFFLKASIVALGIGILCSRRNSHKKLANLKDDPTVGQYLNRLIEFFSDDSLDRAQEEFLDMIDFGVYPKDAFKILTFNGELN